MYLYNVSVIVENDVSEAVKQHLGEWLVTHPAMTLPLSLLELLDSPHEGTTFCIQLRAESKNDITAFQAQHLASAQELLSTRYPGKVLFFDSTMKYLND